MASWPTPTRTALVTGASSGIGKAMALELARLGASRLVLAALDMEGLMQTEKEIREVSRDCTCRLVAGNSCEKEVIEQLVREVGDQLGLLILCAGVGYNGPVDEVTMEQLDRVMQINFRAQIELFLACLPALRAAHGQVGAVTSVQAFLPTPLRSPYSASKAALESFLQSFIVEEGAKPAAQRVGVTLLAPSHVATNLRKNALGEGQNRSAAKGAMTPEYVASAFVRATLARRRRCTLKPKYRLFGLIYYIVPAVIEYGARKMYSL